MEKKYQEYMLKTLEELIKIDSPSGYCLEAARFIDAEIRNLGYESRITNKNCVEGTVKGRDGGKKVALAAHFDTLGAMVTSVDGAGRIRFAKVGGVNLATWDGEYCRIHTRSGKVYEGTFLMLIPSVHIMRESATMPRDPEHMYVRLDENIKTADDVKKLGIDTGDYITLDTKFKVMENGLIKSRFLDDKTGVAIILTALKIMSDKKLTPEFDLSAVFTSYEEVGHGGAPFGADEVLAVDMGCIGGDLKCTESDVSICALDLTGPYDYELVGRLKQICDTKGLSYAVDVYPFYSSDVSVMLRAGKDVKGTVIGPGVHASHGMERTHIRGMENTLELILGYLGV